jgi:hypothetical protein
MTHYRAYIVGLDGHFKGAEIIAVTDNEAAVEKAKQLVEVHNIELWQLDRKIAAFRTKLNPPVETKSIAEHVRCLSDYLAPIVCIADGGRDRGAGWERAAPQPEAYPVDHRQDAAPKRMNRP